MSLLRSVKNQEGSRFSLASKADNENGNFYLPPIVLKENE